MAAVQRVLRAEDGEPHQRVAPLAEHDGRSVAGMDGPVIDHDRIGSEKLAVGLGDDADGRRALFLLAVEQHFYIDGKAAPSTSNAVRNIMIGPLSSDEAGDPPVRVDLVAEEFLLRMSSHWLCAWGRLTTAAHDSFWTTAV